MMNTRFHIMLALLFIVMSVGAIGTSTISSNNQTTTTVLVCPRNASSSRHMRLETHDPVRTFSEVSGLVFSKTQISPLSGAPIFYVITDGKNNNTIGGGRVGVYDSQTGKRLLSYVLSQNTEANWDYEAMTLGSCGRTSGRSKNEDCIYIGDIGDNVALHSNGRRGGRIETRRDYRILKFREPHLLSILGREADNYTIPDTDVWILPFNYHHATSPSSYADSEAMFLDHSGWGDDGSIGDLYLITKWGGTRSLLKNRVFKIDADLWRRRPERTKGGVTFLPVVSPNTVGTYNATAPSQNPFLLFQWRGSDMTQDGTVISLTTKDETHLFLRCPGESVAVALTGFSKACYRFAHAAYGQTETSAWTHDGRRYLQIPEGRRTRMGWSDMTYNHPLSVTRACPSYDSLSTEVPTSEPTMHATSMPSSKKPTSSIPNSKKPTTPIPSSSYPTTEPVSQPTNIPSGNRHEVQNSMPVRTEPTYHADFVVQQGSDSRSFSGSRSVLLKLDSFKLRVGTLLLPYWLASCLFAII